MPDPSTVAARQLLRARRRREWTQAEFARRAEIPASQLCAYETGAKQPSAATLARVLAGAGVELVGATPALERLRQAAELVDVLGLVDAMPPGRPAAEPSFGAVSGARPGMTSFVAKIVAVHDHLAAAGVDHAFGGAIAVGYHVESPRATATVDLNIAAEPNEAGPVLAALPAAVAWTEADLRQIARGGQTRLFWDRTPLDLFFPQHALHALVASRIETVPFAASTIPIVSATDLAIFKALFDRTKDWADIEEMLAYGAVDRREVREWLVRLLGAEDRRIRRLDGLP